jgi:hypothetical protein
MAIGSREMQDAVAGSQQLAGGGGRGRGCGGVGGAWSESEVRIRAWDEAGSLMGNELESDGRLFTVECSTGCAPISTTRNRPLSHSDGGASVPRCDATNRWKCETAQSSGRSFCW